MPHNLQRKYFLKASLPSNIPSPPQIEHCGKNPFGGGESACFVPDLLGFIISANENQKQSGDNFVNEKSPGNTRDHRCA